MAFSKVFSKFSALTSDLRLLSLRRRQVTSDRNVLGLIRETMAAMLYQIAAFDDVHIGYEGAFTEGIFRQWRSSKQWLVRLSCI